MELMRAEFPFKAAHNGMSVHATDGKTKFAGNASVFNTLIDAFVHTRILPGAFTKTLRENAHRIKILHQHNPDEPIGIPTLLREDSHGLYVEAQLSTTARGLEVAQLMRDGVLTELSIGFDPLKHVMVNEDGLGQVRHISELRLWEISVVSWGANRDAKITQVHRRALTVDDRLGALDAMAAQLDDFDYRQTVRVDDRLSDLNLAALNVGMRTDTHERQAELAQLAASIRRGGRT